MAARDSNLFKLIFQPNGVIAQFKQSPEKRSVILERRYFGKRPTLKLLRFLLPRYRVFREDDQLVEELYDHQEDDPNIRRLTLQPEPILSETHHNQLEEVDRKPPEQREEFQDKAVEKVISEASKEPGSTVSTATAVLEKPPESVPGIVSESKALSEEKAPVVNEAERIIQQAKQVETPGFIKSLVSGGSIQAKKLLTPINIASAISSGIGAVAGFGIAGPAGALAGVGAGLVVTGTVAQGGGNTILQFGAGIADRVSESVSGLIKVPLFFLSPKKWIILGLAVIVALMTLGGAKPTGTSTPSLGGLIGGLGCPGQLAIEANKLSADSCRYLNPSIDLFDTNISKDSIDAYVIKYSTIFVSAGKGDVAEFRKRVNYIVDSSTTVGLNPSLFLGYWKTESNFSTSGNRDTGCLGDNFYEQVDCSLGINLFSDPVKNPVPNCAKSKAADSSACTTLKGIRRDLDLANPIKYPISTFDDFAESYGPRAPDFDGPGTINNNCVSTYNKLLEVATELNMCKPSATVASCPVPGGKIKTSSFQASPTTGHCSPSYGSCPAESRRAKAIDIDTEGQSVLFPTINNQSVTWKYVTELSLDKAADCEGGVSSCGKFYVFRAQLGLDYWSLHLLHLDPTKVVFDKTDKGNLSGTQAGTTTPGVYLHIELGKNVVNYSSPPLGSTDLDPGWIAADFMCK